MAYSMKPIPKRKLDCRDLSYPDFSLTKSYTLPSKANRLIQKSGKVTLQPSRVPQMKKLTMSDFFTTFVEANWCLVIGMYLVVFIFSWAFFGTVWFAIFWLRFRFDSGVTCVDNVDSWTSAFLLSVETQTTIGYGGRQITPQCPEAVVCLLLQSLAGFLLTTSLLGFFFAKLSRANPRSKMVLFSECAVVKLHNDQLALMFRVADARKSQLIDATISLHCFRFKTDENGHEVLKSQRKIPITIEHEQESDELIKPFLLIPLTVVHVIDKQSPLYKIGPQQLANSRMEFIVVLEGVVESTGSVIQAKTSYLADEILWGQKFCNISLYDAMKTDLSSFDKTTPKPTPEMSAEEYEQSKRTQTEVQEDETVTSDSEEKTTENGDCKIYIEPNTASSTQRIYNCCKTKCNCVTV